MTYVVGKPCVLCKYGDCVEVCPVECFFEERDLDVVELGDLHRLQRVRTGLPAAGDHAGDRATRVHRAQRGRTVHRETKRTKKDQVKHGPNWDANLAGAERTRRGPSATARPEVRPRPTPREPSRGVGSFPAVGARSVAQPRSTAANSAASSSVSGWRQWRSSCSRTRR